MESYLGVKDEVIKAALSASMGARGELKIDSRPSQVIVAFPGSWSPDDWFREVSKAEPFGDDWIDREKFPSLRNIGKDENARVNKAFMARFQSFLDDGSQTLRSEVTTAVEKDKQLVFAGHSSGGPIAIYATIWFLEGYVRPKKKQAPRPLCLTFASPLTTDRIFCHAVHRERWSDCFVHFITKLDIVPRLLLAPHSAVTELLQEIRPFFNRHHKADEAKLVSLFENVMKDASRVARHPACAPTESEPTSSCPVSTTKLSPYRPFGKYVFCTETGRLVVVKNPDAVLQMLSHSLQNEFDAKNQDTAVASLKAHWTYEDTLYKSLGVRNEVRLANLRGVPLDAHDNTDIGAALNDLSLCQLSRLHLRAAGKTEKQKGDDLKTVESKKGAINKALKALEEHRTRFTEDGVAYYDAFKEERKETNLLANVDKLTVMWDEIIEMARNERLPDEFEADKVWMELGTRFRRLVEPIDIANYYRHLKNEDAGPYMTNGRPERYQYLQRWREHAEQLEIGSSGESCFWAEVEELNIAITNEKQPGKEIENRVSTLKGKLKEWKDEKAVEQGEFFENSTLVKWWRLTQDNH